MLTSPVETSGLEHAQHTEQRRVWKGPLEPPRPDKSRTHKGRSLLPCAQSLADDWRCLVLQDTEFCWRTVCQDHVVNRQTQRRLSRATGLPLQRFPFMVFTERFGCGASKSTAWRRRLNSNSSLREPAQREKREIALKSLKAGLFPAFGFHTPISISKRSPKISNANKPSC